MSLTNPLPQIQPLQIVDGLYPPSDYFPDILGPSYRRGVTDAQLISALEQWIVRVLIPFENTQIETIDAGRQEGLDALTATVNGALTEQAETVNAAVNTAVAAIMNATIPITDPIFLAVINNAQSQTRAKLDQFYGLTNEKLLAYIQQASSGNPNAQVRAALDLLYALDSTKILNAVNLTGDSVFRNWLDSRYGVKQSGNWIPSWGGDSGARIGDNAVSEGLFTRQDSAFWANSRIVFGSNAIFGGGVLVGTNFGGPPITGITRMTGTYVPYQSAQPTRQVHFLPLTTNEWKAYIDRGNGFEAISVLGNPVQQSQLIVSAQGYIGS